MIDINTRRKILKLKEEGHSNAKIRELVGVSLPTIRKILLEADHDDGRKKNAPATDVEVLEEKIKRLEEQIDGLKRSRDSALISDDWSTQKIQPVDTFVVNLSRNWPYRTNTPFQILRNGVPFWDLRRILSMIFPISTANKIVYEIEKLDLKGIFEVQVMHNFHGAPQITVQSLRS